MTTTTSSESLYQQLRGHLTELKLADAADALPSILDQAQAEDWTLTHALERLLAIEVSATEQRRLAGRFRFANLPPAPRWRTSTTTPHPASTPTSSPSWGPAGSWRTRQTCCSSALPE